jgi:hypothetical protein
MKLKTLNDKIQIIVEALIETQKYEQLCPHTIKLLEECRDEN